MFERGLESLLQSDIQGIVTFCSQSEILRVTTLVLSRTEMPDFSEKPLPLPLGSFFRRRFFNVRETGQLLSVNASWVFEFHLFFDIFHKQAIAEARRTKLGIGNGSATRYK